MASRRSRETAYGDLVAGLLDVRQDPATERFDAELAAAEQDDRIDPQTARVLRWWQRESLRSVVTHARSVVPQTLLALEQAAQGAGEDAESAAASLARVSGEPATGRLGAPRPRPRIDPLADDVSTDQRTEASTQASTDASGEVPDDLEARRRRMLVAGLTRVRRDQ